MTSHAKASRHELRRPTNHQLAALLWIDEGCDPWAWTRPSGGILNSIETRGWAVRPGDNGHMELTAEGLLAIGAELRPLSPEEQEERDRINMARAIDYAERSIRQGGVGFGCVIANRDGVEFAYGAGTGTVQDPTKHSEVEAIRMAAATLLRPLRGCTLYSTHEPCAMCAGAINHAKLSRVVFGTYRRDYPGTFRRRHHTCEQLLHDTSHPPEIVEGYMRRRCLPLLRRAEA